MARICNPCNFHKVFTKTVYPKNKATTFYSCSLLQLF